MKSNLNKSVWPFYAYSSNKYRFHNIWKEETRRLIIEYRNLQEDIEKSGRLKKKCKHNIEELENLRSKIVEWNLWLVFQVAGRYKREWVEFDDLLQSGIEWLIIWFSKFDIDRFLNWKVEFATYIYYRIRQTILKYLNTDKSIRIPENKKGHVLQLEKIKSHYFTEYWDEPDDEYLIEEMWVDEKRFKAIKQAGNATKNISLEIKDEEDSSWIILLDTKESIIEILHKNELKEAVREALSFVWDREKEILSLRFRNCTLQEISNIYWITKERVRQIIVNSLDKIKNSSCWSRLSKFV